MNIIETGTGAPVVLIPGVQGRWEWMAPAVQALGRRCRVITFSLADEPSSGTRFDAARGFEAYVEQTAAALDAAGLDRAVICGISYGGLIASAFAARHPERTASVALVSALPPAWTPDARVRFYLRAPRLLAPVFVLASIRLYREFASASGWWRGTIAAIAQALRVVAHPFSPTRMARRVRLAEHAAGTTDLSSVQAPALIVAGEPHLDRVVPVRATRTYLAVWPQARFAQLDRTGHLGLITRPDEFASIIGRFADETAGRPQARRRVG